ncbi:putative Serine protease [Tenacibaculum sediminilitoris]|uniref:trypsin-like serine peptidase n=1 Tax=Tenacibaculum sediminilitoris TaxID=1820334 RepID=UPI0038953DA7
MLEENNLIDEITFNQIQELKLNNICYQSTTRGSFWPFKASFNSTSFFIDKNVLLTSAHNVVKTYRSVNKLVVAPARVGKMYHYGKFSINTENSKNFSIFPDYDMRNKPTRGLYDIALIYIPNHVIDSNTSFTYQNSLPLLEDISSLSINEEVYCAGYPASGKHKNRYRMTLDKSKITEINEHSFTHNLSTATGNSGSPIMVKRNNQLYIIGVNSIKHNGTLINDVKKNWIQQSKEILASA